MALYPVVVAAWCSVPMLLGRFNGKGYGTGIVYGQGTQYAR